MWGRIERVALGEEAHFEALYSLPPLNLARSKKLHLTTEPAFLPKCLSLVSAAYVMCGGQSAWPFSTWRSILF
jgi:hypothetical protein